MHLTGGTNFGKRLIHCKNPGCSSIRSEILQCVADKKDKQYFKQKAKPPVLFMDIFSQELDENSLEKNEWISNLKS